MGYQKSKCSSTLVAQSTKIANTITELDRRKDRQTRHAQTEFLYSGCLDLFFILCPWLPMVRKTTRSIVRRGGLIDGGTLKSPVSLASVGKWPVKRQFERILADSSIGQMPVRRPLRTHSRPRLIVERRRDKEVCVRRTDIAARRSIRVAWLKEWRRQPVEFTIPIAMKDAALNNIDQTRPRASIWCFRSHCVYASSGMFLSTVARAVYAYNCISVG